jgi:hypothetical protein
MQSFTSGQFCPVFYGIRNNEFLAHILGTPHTTVTLTAGILHKSELIGYARGRAICQSDYRKVVLGLEGGVKQTVRSFVITDLHVRAREV